MQCLPMTSSGSNKTDLRRRGALRALSAAAMTAHSVRGSAQPTAFPSRPLRLIVSHSPGGTADQLARAIAEGASRSLGQPIVVENKPGANGNLGADIVAKSAPDGHVLLISAPGPLAVNSALYESLPFDPKTAFAPISRVAVAPLLLVVSAKLPVKTLQGLLAYLKANPAKATFASQGNASSGHLAMELLLSKTGLLAVHVPYRGSAPALNDLLAGHVTMLFDNTTSSLPHVRAGSLRAIAVAEPLRIAAVPEVPTVAESGLPGFSATPWFGIVTTGGTPAAVIEKLNAAINQFIHTPAVQQRFAQAGVILIGDSPLEFASYIDTETRKWREVVRISGAKAD